MPKVVKTMKLNTKEIGGKLRTQQSERLFVRSGEVVRVENTDQSKSITVFMDDEGAKSLFDPVPSALGITLAPGAHIDWFVKEGIASDASANMRTEPQSAIAKDHKDFHADC